MSPPSRVTLLRLLVLAALAGGLAIFLFSGGADLLSLQALARHRETLLAWRDENAALVLAAFIVAYALTVAFSVPGSLWLTIAGGFMFGTVAGALAAVIGATAGASVVFLAARFLAGDGLRHRLAAWISRMDRGFRSNAFSYLLFLRLAPVFPFWLVNLVPAFLDVSFRLYLAATILGIVPGAVVYSLVGNGLGAVLDAGGKPDVDIIYAPDVLAPILGLALLSLLPVLRRRLRASARRNDVRDGEAEEAQ